MLAIRLQRTGRKGHAQFRVIVQDSRFSPSSGRVVDYLGNYDPHSKVVSFDKLKVADYLSKGAQPTDRMVGLLKKEGVKIPSWVSIPSKQKKAIKHPEKLRRNRPAGEPAPKPAEPAPEEAPAEEKAEAVSEAEAPKTSVEEAPEAAAPAGEPEPQIEKAESSKSEPNAKEDNQEIAEKDSEKT